MKYWRNTLITMSSLNKVCIVASQLQTTMSALLVARNTYSILQLVSTHNTVSRTLIFVVHNNEDHMHNWSMANVLQ